MAIFVKGARLTEEGNTVVGYYNLKRIREGQVFQIEEESHFSHAWMERLQGAELRDAIKSTEVKVGRSKQAKAHQEALASVVEA